MSTAAAARPSILSHFEDLSDPRMDRTKLHRLTDKVAIALCVAICGAEGWADVERFGKMKVLHRFPWHAVNGLRSSLPQKNRIRVL